MCYAYVMPDTTAKYGVVGKDGKQSISVYKNGSRYTYIADKNKVDEFSKYNEEFEKNSNKGTLALFGSFLGLMGGFAGFGHYHFTNNIKFKKIGIVSSAVAALSALYAATKYIGAYNNKKDSEKVLEEIKKSQ